MSRLFNPKILTQAIHNGDTLTAFVAAQNGVESNSRNIESACWYCTKGVRHTDNWSAFMLAVARKDEELLRVFVQNLQPERVTKQYLHLLIDLAELYEQKNIREQLLQLVQ